MQSSTAFAPWGAMSGPSTTNIPQTASMPRRRNPLACETCYKRKIKCEVEGSNPACIQCMRRNTRCKFTTRKEKRENIKRAQYVRSLEERLKKTESLLKAAGIWDEESFSQDELADGDDDDDDDYDDEMLEDDSELEDENYVGSPQLSNEPIRNGKSSARGQRTVSSGTARSSRSSCASLDSNTTSHRDSIPGCSDIQQIPFMKLDDKEDSRYYGRSSFLSILSRDGIEWIKSKTGDVSFLKVLFTDSSRDSPWDYWRPDVFHDLFASKVFKPLPPRGEVFALLRDYFRTVNRLFPIYHEESFMQLVEWQYTQQTCDDAARWASINIILSLAYEYRFSNSLKPEKDRERAWLYFKNAMSVFAELTMRRTDLMSVQALLGMAIFLRGNSGVQSALPIVTAAVRSCHRMGLHRDISRPYLSPIEQEQRRRVFWVAYILDQSTCIRAGNAPAQHADDFDVDLPVEDINDGCPVGNKTSFFRQLCRLTVTKSRIYSKLYSTKALSHKGPAEIIEAVHELHAELEEWRESSPFDTHVKQKGAGEDFLLGFASVGLQFVYYNSLIMIHRLPLLMNLAVTTGLSTRLDPKLLSRQSAMSGAICVQAARDTLKLVNNMPWGDIAWIWSILYYVFLAVMTIFVSVLRDTKNPKSREDLQSLNMAATFFATLIPGEGQCHYATFMAKMAANFERIARMVLEREEKSIVRQGSEASSSASNEKVEKTEKPSPSTSRVAAPSRHPQPPPTNRSGAIPSSSKTPSPSSTNTTRTHGLDIPHLEGLPAINSSGYFVPESPTANSEELPSSTNPPPYNNTFHQTPPTTTPTPATTAAAAAAAAAAGLPNPTTRPLPPGYTPSYGTPATFSASPTFASPPNMSNTPLEFWQIPVTDWGLGGQFMGGLFANDFLGGDPLASMAPNPFDPGMPFGDQNQNQNQNQNLGPQGPGAPDGSSSMWPGGFMGPF